MDKKVAPDLRKKTAVFGKQCWARSKTRKPRKSRKPRKVIFRCFLSEFSSEAYGIFENSEDENSENIFRDFREIRVFELPLFTELSKEWVNE